MLPHRHHRNPSALNTSVEVMVQAAQTTEPIFVQCLLSPIVSLLSCFLCCVFPPHQESCKDILAATGNYAQPEVTTLT